MNVQSFDYIIVGAGSAGSVLAARLSDNGRFSVLLLEAGPSDRRFWIRTPLGYSRSYNDAAVNWRYDSEPVEAFGGRTVYVPRGKVLGGSSSINALVYIRGHPSDYDDWERLGNRGWGWRDVLPVYKRIEDHEFGASDWHGAGGPLRVSDFQGDAEPICGAYYRAGGEAGVPLNRDFNGAAQEGVGPYQITVRDGIRASASRAYLWPALKRKNLAVETVAQATRILFEGKRATGVEYRRGGRLVEAQARREVILSAGAINSPQLLLLSGIGDPTLLRRLGIQLLHEAPEVGRNLQDHLAYDHYYHANMGTLNDRLNSWIGQLFIGIQYVFFSSGPLSMSVNQAGGFVRTRAGLDRPNMQLYFCPLSFQKAPPKSSAIVIPEKASGFSLTVSPCRPTSRGSVELRLPDPLAPPAIRPNYLSSEHDVAEIMEGANFMRKLASMPSLAAVIAKETIPGPDCDTDEEMLAHIRAKAASIFHPCGTCRMGPDAASAVVDDRLRIHGLEGLRVIDASIFPTIPAGNLNAPSIMVGEKGAAMVLEDAGGG